MPSICCLLLALLDIVSVRLLLCRLSIPVGLGKTSVLPPRSEPGRDNTGSRPWFGIPVLWGPCEGISGRVVRQILR